MTFIMSLVFAKAYQIIAQYIHTIQICGEKEIPQLGQIENLGILLDVYLNAMNHGFTAHRLSM